MPLNPRWALPVLLLLLSGSQAVAAQSQNTGSFTIARFSDQGNSAYAILYHYPREVALGQNATFTITVEVTSLTGLKAYLIAYGVSVSLSLPGKTLFAQANQSSPHLYQGSHWGPVKVTIPLDQNAHLGSATVGNVTIAFFGDVWYDSPILFDYPESGAQTVGTLAIGREGSSGNLLNPVFSAALVAGAVAVLILGAALGSRLLRRTQVRPIGRDSPISLNI